MLFFYILGFATANLVLYNIDYLTQRPIYLCETPTGSGNFEECTFD